MARVSIVFGMLLCGLSAAGMISSITKDPVQFIPMMFGIPVLFCGVVSLNPHRRRFAMRSAAVLTAFGGLVGIVLIVSRMMSQVPDHAVSPRVAFVLMGSMLAICWTQAVLQAIMEFQGRRAQASQRGVGASSGVAHAFSEFSESDEDESCSTEIPTVKSSPDP